MRALFVTALPAQIGSYIMKEAAARRWLADNTASTAMLEPEATARGMTLVDLAHEVIAKYAEWETPSGLIEGVRFGAKARLAAATTLPEIVAAAIMDWSVFDAPAA